MKYWNEKSNVINFRDNLHKREIPLADAGAISTRSFNFHNVVHSIPKTDEISILDIPLTILFFNSTFIIATCSINPWILRVMDTLWIMIFEEQG